MKLRFDFTKTDNTIISSNVVDIPTGGPLYDEVKVISGISQFNLYQLLRTYKDTFNYFSVEIISCSASDKPYNFDLLYGTILAPATFKAAHVNILGCRMPGDTPTAQFNIHGINESSEAESVATPVVRFNLQYNLDTNYTLVVQSSLATSLIMIHVKIW